MTTTYTVVLGRDIFSESRNPKEVLRTVKMLEAEGERPRIYRMNEVSKSDLSSAITRGKKK